MFVIFYFVIIFIECAQVFFIAVNKCNGEIDIRKLFIFYKILYSKIFPIRKILRIKISHIKYTL